MDIASIILAAGSSSRMGSPKPLVRLSGKTFLRRIIDTHKALRLPVYVVLGETHQDIMSALDLSDVKVVINSNPDLGQLSSLRAALEQIQPEPSGFIIHPVDHPLVTVKVIQALINTHHQSPEHILIPRVGELKGHPVLFPALYSSDLMQAPLDEGARWVVHQNSKAVLYVPVEDRGILINIDTPEDMRRAAKRREAGGRRPE